MLTRISVLLLLLALVASACAGQPEQLPYTLAPESALPEFVSHAAPTVKEAYRFAINNMHELENYPCYCGCGAMGHTSNLGCYIQDVDTLGTITFDRHATGCGICVDITLDVMRLLKEGRSSLEIRTYIDAQYSSFGPSTNTPLPEA